MHAGDVSARIGLALDNLETVLGQVGLDLSNVMRLNFYITDVDAFFEAHGVAAARMAEAGCRPASMLLGVTRLAFPELLVEIEATAVA